MSNQNNESLGSESTIGSQLRELCNSPGWKYIVGELNKVKDSIIKQILTPRTDQRMLFTADQIFKERLEVIDSFLVLPELSIKDIDNRLFVMQERAKPLEKRISEF
jgi:hypothetical protein